MYHDLFEKEKSESGFQTVGSMPYKLRVELFERHVKAVKGYTEEHKDIDVVFSFDDGGKSFYTFVAPILEKYGYRGLFFIATKYINEDGFLTTAQIKDLSSRGHYIGSHSHSHALLNTLNKNELQQEWRLSTGIIKDILGSCKIASIPNGAGGKYVLHVAYEEGLRILYTSDPIIKQKQYKDMSIIGRFVVVDGMDEDDVLKILSSSTCRMRLYLRWEVLQFGKRLLGGSYKRIKDYLLNKRK